MSCAPSSLPRIRQPSSHRRCICGRPQHTRCLKLQSTRHNTPPSRQNWRIWPDLTIYEEIEWTQVEEEAILVAPAVGSNPRSAHEVGMRIFPAATLRVKGVKTRQKALQAEPIFPNEPRLLPSDPSRRRTTKKDPPIAAPPSSLSRRRRSVRLSSKRGRQVSQTVNVNNIKGNSSPPLRSSTAAPPGKGRERRVPRPLRRRP